MTSKDPGEFRDQSTGQFKVQSLADAVAEHGALPVPTGQSEMDAARLEVLTLAASSEYRADVVAGAVERLEASVREDALRRYAPSRVVHSDPCTLAHYDPERAAVVPLDGPALWYLSDADPVHGARIVARVDSGVLGGMPSAEDSSDDGHRQRLLLRALIDHVRGMLEGGDYS
jgi:hypothetical protein